MKVWKKNMVAAAVLVTVCAGIYVNWLYTEENAAALLQDCDIVLDALDNIPGRRLLAAACEKAGIVLL